MKCQSPFPHVVIRASAGTGKTYQLALRFIGLLVAGAQPDEILATTFTRKAAGEILDRVLHWLAQAAADESERGKLAQAIGVSALSQQQCSDLLKSTVRRLHTLRVGTLDSHFLRVATSFGHELGLPPGWTICDELTDAILRDQAIEQVLAGRLSDVLTLLHSLTKGVATRSVARLVRDTIASLLELYRETSPAAWSQIPVSKGLEADERDELLAHIEGLVIANQRMSQARLDDLARFRAETWDEFLEKGLAAKVLTGECAFYKKPIPADVVAPYQRLLQHVESIVVGQVARQTEATHQLLERFVERYRTLQLDERALRFSDVTFRLAETADSVAPQRMAFRLDGGIRHLLLDEFQDTSPAQWRVLRPLAEHVSRQSGGTFFCVGDTKQAIYGWRGGVAEIFDALEGQLSGLTTRRLDASYRSSSPVIETVNQVFARLSSHPHLDKLAEPVRAWEQAFPHHTTERGDLAGHVTLSAAPLARDGEEQAAATLQHAAQRVRDSVTAAPGATIGVLVRTNAAVARMIYELRNLGIAASEEGGNPLVDSPAVELILSLLKLADHPADSVARFHLATSPLAAPLELTDRRHDAAAARISQQLRRQLMEAGYGATIFDWARRLAPHCDDRDLSRLQQLVELAYEYQPASTLRTSDFLRLVATRRVADPQPAAVRVMTIHQAKGLEFHIVFLPELEGRLVGQPDRVVAGRPGPTDPVNVVCRLANENVRQFFPPALQKLFHDDMCLEVSESLCVLYVAMTRAVHALHMLVAPSRPNEKHMPKTFAGLLRATLATNQPAAPAITLYEHGDPNVAGTRAPTKWVDVPPAPQSSESIPTGEIHLAPAVPRRARGLERTSPSALEGGSRILGAAALAMRPDMGFNIGTLIHAWCQRIEWLDDGSPTDDELRQIADRLRSETGDLSPQLDALITRFRQSLAVDRVAHVLSRSYYDSPKNLGLARMKQWPAGPIEQTALRERAFAIRVGDNLLSGSIDRLVILKSGGRAIAADIIDFKTDELPANDNDQLEMKIDFYRPQIDAYRAAASQFLAIDPAHISARLIFLSIGAVCQV